jgi:hypothetical protein
LIVLANIIFDSISPFATVDPAQFVLNWVEILKARRLPLLPPALLLMALAICR